MGNLWDKYKNLPARKRQTVHSLSVGFAFFVFLYILTKIFSVSLCPINNIFGISCFGCGLTRGFIAILELDFKKAFEYNVMSLPLFLGIFSYCIVCFWDIVFHREYVVKIEEQLSKKYMYAIYVVILIISSILNNIF